MAQSDPLEWPEAGPSDSTSPEQRRNPSRLMVGGALLVLLVAMLIVGILRMGSGESTNSLESAAATATLKAGEEPTKEANHESADDRTVADSSTAGVGGDPHAAGDGWGASAESSPPESEADQLTSTAGGDTVAADRYADYVAPPDALLVGATGPGAVTMRSSPGSLEVVGAWGSGTPLAPTGQTAQSEGARWTQVRDPNGKEGWVLTGSLRSPSDEELASARPRPASSGPSKAGQPLSSGSSQAGQPSNSGTLASSRGSAPQAIEALLPQPNSSQSGISAPPGSVPGLPPDNGFPGVAPGTLGGPIIGQPGAPAVPAAPGLPGSPGGPVLNQPGTGGAPGSSTQPSSGTLPGTWPPSQEPPGSTQPKTSPTESTPTEPVSVPTKQNPIVIVPPKQNPGNTTKPSNLELKPCQQCHIEGGAKK